MLSFGGGGFSLGTSGGMGFAVGIACICLCILVLGFGGSESCVMGLAVG